MSVVSRPTDLGAYPTELAATSLTAVSNMAILVSCRCRFAFDPTRLAAFTPEWRQAHATHCDAT